MTSVAQILVSMSQQMYEDIKFITQHNPTQVVDEDTAKMYNNLLAEIRGNYPFSQQVLVFENMVPRTLKYKDAMVVIGQLSCLLKALTAPDPRRVQQPEEQQANGPSSPGWLPPVTRNPLPVVPATNIGNNFTDEAPTTAMPSPVPAQTPRQTPRIIQERAGLTHDPELYGPTPPVHLNDDGTVRFSLDE